MHRLLLAILLSLLAPPLASPYGLESAFDKGFLLDDTNADGHFDAVVRTISVRPEASPAEYAAAAEIAARLGHETMALDLGLVVAGDAPAGRPAGVLIGRAHPGAPAEGQSLSPGQGLLMMLGGRIWVAGADDDGTRAAATYFAARAPAIWAPDGPTWQKLLQDLSAVLDAAQIRAQTPFIERVVLQAEGQGVAYLTVAVDLSGRADLRRAEAALLERTGEPRLRYPGLAELRIELRAPGLSRTVRIAGERGPVVAPAATPAPGEPKSFGLADLYTPNGLLSDADKDFIPDGTETAVLLGPQGAGAAAGDLAARIGLESTGIRLPLTRLPSDVDEPGKLRDPVILGEDHPLARKLAEEKKVDLAGLGRGEGLARVVRKAFGEQTAVVVAGADADGFAAAADHLARRLPYLWDIGKGNLSLRDVEEDVRRFFAARSDVGQAASAAYRLKRLAKKLNGKDLESVEARVYTEKAPDDLAGLLEKDLRGRLRADRVDVHAAALDVQRGPVVFDETWEFLWEVDDFWKAFRAKVLPRIKRGRKVEIELRVSESPETRSRLAGEIRQELSRKGVRPEEARVDVLSAYKQGYSWLVDRVLPEIRGRDVASLEIRFAVIERYPPAIRWQRIESPIRWLQELYPVDEVLARDLRISPDQIVFERSFEDKPIYRVSVKDPSGKEFYSASFDPTFVVTPFLAAFPSYEKVRVTTGWLRASVDGKLVADERILTDPERFWERYQKDGLGRLHDYTLDLYEGKPEARHAPYFGELTVDLEMSEPDYRLGIDQEQISSLEALHEDTFFETVAFFDVLGLQYSGEPLHYPGRIIPVIHPPREGRGATVKVRLTGKAAGHPRIELAWKERGGRLEKKREEVAKVEVEDPKAEAELAQAGEPGLRWLEIRVPVDMAEDRRDELLLREREPVVDRLILSAEQARGMVEALGAFHAAGLFRDRLSYENLGQIRFRFVTEGSENSIGPLATLSATGRGPSRPDLKAIAAGYRYRGERLVEWREPVSPDAAEQIVARLSTLEGVEAYWCGRSYLGRNIWAMDFMLPMKGELWSQAKASTLKPVVIYSGRQHANEVSSTSHLLRLAELLATEPAYRKYLEKVNVVIHPVTNPDGAALAYELYKITPHHMLHAGYLGALGVDVTTPQWSRDPIYPESAVRKELWQTWLPDFFLNPHGYPSHEWVQLFGGYSAWVRSRDPQARDWWSVRGWFVPGFSFVQDPKFPKHKEVALALKDRLAERIRETPEVHAMNQRMYRRYMKYGRWDPEVYKQDLHKETLIYTPVKGAKQDPQSPSFQSRHPNVTVVELVQESPDETASGDWLELVAGAGLAFDLANLEFLYDSVYQVKRERKAEGDGVLLKVSRKRPVLPPGSALEER